MPVGSATVFRPKIVDALGETNEYTCVGKQPKTRLMCDFCGAIKRSNSRPSKIKINIIQWARLLRGRKTKLKAQ